MGSRVGRGEEEFRKVDYTYVVQSCEVCEKMGIPHFSLCSSGRANKDSWFLFMRVKGDSEEEIKKKAVQYKTFTSYFVNKAHFIVPASFSNAIITNEADEIFFIVKISLINKSQLNL